MNASYKYRYHLFSALTQKSELMREGTHFITLTQQITSDHWELVCPGRLYDMSWGSATIYVHVKVKPPALPNLVRE
jgi:hypothetical protein